MNYKVGDKVRNKRSGVEYVVIGEALDKVKIAEIGNTCCTELRENELEPITGYLTTEEFIKEVEKLGVKGFHEEHITEVCICGRSIARVSEMESHKIDTISNGFQKLKQKERLYNLLDRYARTPLDKRVAEKGFYLKFPKINSVHTNYFNSVTKEGEWEADTKVNSTHRQTIFTEADIPELQEKFKEINFQELERVEVN